MFNNIRNTQLVSLQNCHPDRVCDGNHWSEVLISKCLYAKLKYVVSSRIATIYHESNYNDNQHYHISPELRM